MKKLLLSSLVLLFAAQGFAEHIIRTAKIQLSQNPSEKLGIYTIEVKIESLQMGAGVIESDKYADFFKDEPSNPTPIYQCVSELKINQDVQMTYTLKNEQGTPIARKTIYPELSSTRTKNVSRGASCLPQFASREGTTLSHASQFVDFKVGSNKILSVGANFSGHLILDEPAYQFYTDENSFKNLNWFLNTNERSGSTPLIDPANPPVIEEFDWSQY